MHGVDWRPERPRRCAGAAGAAGADQVAAGGGGAMGGVVGGTGFRKEAGIVIDLSSGNTRSWRTPATMAWEGHSGTPPEKTLSNTEELTGKPEAKCQPARSPEVGSSSPVASVPPILSLPPETLAHVFGMLDPLEVVSATCANPDWLEVANRLVLTPRGHFIIRLDTEWEWGSGGALRREPPVHSVHTLHLVAAPPNGLDDDFAVGNALTAGGPSPDAIKAVWLHEDGCAVDDVMSVEDMLNEEIQNLERNKMQRRQRTVTTIMQGCKEVTSINFFNVHKFWYYMGYIVNEWHRERFRMRVVFTEHDWEAKAALSSMDDYGAFFEEMVLTTWRPQMSVTAFYPHYWEPSSELRFPYSSEIRRLCLQGSGLQAEAYRALADMTALQELRLCYADGLEDDALVGLATKLRLLRRLAVHGAPAVSSQGWAAALKGAALKHLESLEVGRCLQLDDDALSSLQAEDALVELKAVELDLESCERVSGATVDAIALACPNVESLTLEVAYSPSMVEALERVPESLQRLKRLTVRVLGADWPGDPKEPIAAVDKLKRRLRSVCRSSVRMDVQLTFLKLGVSVFNSSEDTNHQQG